jgi:outer membrane immunogenic protein
MRNIARLILASAAAIALPLATQAADLPVRRAAPVAAPFNWTGVYIGISAGEIRHGSDDHLVGTPLLCNPAAFPGSPQFTGLAFPIPPSCDNGAPGVGSPSLFAQVQSIPEVVSVSGRSPMWGGQVGYNHQFYRFVAGFEADFHATRTDGTFTVAGAPTPVPWTPGGDSFVSANPLTCCNYTSQAFVEERMRQFGTLRARLGWLPWDPVLIYATAGLAYAHISSTALVQQQYNVKNNPGDIPALNSCCQIISPAFATSDNWRAGVTVGGGIEIALGARLSVKADYLYYKLGNWTYDLTQLTAVNIGPSPFVDFNPVGATATVVAVNATTRNFNGSRWVVGLNYNFGAPDYALDRRP